MTKALKIAVISFGVVVSPSAWAGNTYATNTVAGGQVAQQSASQVSTVISSRISQAVSAGTSSGTAITPTVPSGGGGGGGTGGPGGPGGPGGTPQQGSSLLNFGDGKSAGSATKDFGVWANFGNAWIKDDHQFENFHGIIATAVLGGDYRVTDQFLVGVATGYEGARITTPFNNGSLTANNVGIAPYMGYNFNQNYSVDATAGYAFLKYNMTRLSNSVYGTTYGGRVFGATNFNAKTTMGNWQLGTGLGYMYLSEAQNAYREMGTAGTQVDRVNIRLGQLRSTTRVGYFETTDWGFLNPYVSVRPEYDVNKSPAGIVDATTGTKAVSDRFGATFAGGLVAGVGDDLTLMLEGSSGQFRSHMSMNGLTGTIRYRF